MGIHHVQDRKIKLLTQSYLSVQIRRVSVVLSLYYFCCSINQNHKHNIYCLNSLRKYIANTWLLQYSLLLENKTAETKTQAVL